MKRFLTTLIALVFTFSAFAQSALDKRLDKRCYSHNTFAASLVIARRSGITEEDAMLRFAKAYERGSFGDVSKEELELMQKIIHVMYESPVDTDDEARALILKAQRECILALFTISA